MLITKHVCNRCGLIPFTKIITEKFLDMAAERRHLTEMMSEKDISVSPGRENRAIYECLSIEESIFYFIIFNILCSTVFLFISLNTDHISLKESVYIFQDKDVLRIDFYLTDNTTADQWSISTNFYDRSILFWKFYAHIDKITCFFIKFFPNEHTRAFFRFSGASKEHFVVNFLYFLYLTTLFSENIRNIHTINIENSS